MTLQQILDFLAVVQSGSMRAAARATGQTQPALSKSLRRLEDAIGAALVERSATGVALTSYGHRFLDHARLIAAESRRAKESIAQLLGQRLGQVSYGVSPIPSILLAPAAVGEFRKRYPAVELNCQGGLYYTLLPALRDGRIDFAVCAAPREPGDSEFMATPLLHSTTAIVARRNHRLAHVRSLAALKNASFVITGPSGGPGGSIYELFSRAGLEPPSVAVRCDSFFDTLTLLADSDLIGTVPAVLLGRGFLKEALAALPIEEPLPKYRIGVFRRVSSPLTPAAGALVAQFERQASYLKG